MKITEIFQEVPETKWKGLSGFARCGRLKQSFCLLQRWPEGAGSVGALGLHPLPPAVCPMPGPDSAVSFPLGRSSRHGAATVSWSVV